VTLGSVGSYNARVTATNSEGSDTYTFTLVVTHDVDSVSPTISVTSPANGAEFDVGDSASFAATATDNVAVDRVEFFVDGSPYHTDTTSPYAAPGYTFTAGDTGSVQFRATAYDTSGNYASDTNTVIVGELVDIVDPTVSVTSPANGAEFDVGDSTSVAATASDNLAVDRVEFLIDGNWYYTDDSPPYSTPSYTFTADDAGSVQFEAVAYDTSGNDASDTNTVTVIGNQPPVARIVADDPIGTGPYLVNFDASSSYDPDGTIDKYEWDYNGEVGGWNWADTGSYPSFQKFYSPGTYEPTVRVTDNDGATDTDTVTIKVGGSINPPNAPSGLTATAVSSSQINLSWNDNSSNEDGFKIERKTGAGGTWGQITTVGANTTTYNNTGLSANTTYYYRVRAYNSEGNSSYSNEDSDTTFDEATWHTETVDGADYTGYYPSLSFDTSNVPHISYIDDDNNKLMRAYKSGSSWYRSTARSPGTSINYTAIGLRVNGHIWIFHYLPSTGGGSLWYSYYDGSSWGNDSIDSGLGAFGGHVSAVLTPAGNPHVAYYDGTNKDLKHAYYNGSSWEKSTVYSDGDCGRWTDIAVDSSGYYPRISYWRQDDQSVRYSWHDGSWHHSLVESGLGQFGGYTSIALSSSNTPYISYFEAVNGNLKLAWYDGSWEKYVIDNGADDGGNVGTWTSIAVDDDSGVHISYTVWTGDNPVGDVKYAYYLDPVLTIDKIDTANSSGTSLALDSSGYPHIAYHTYGNHLKYAWYGP